MVKRIAIGVLALVVLLLVVIAGAAYWLLSGDGVRVALERQASAYLGEPVRIGSASAKVFPRLAVQLEDVRIGDPVRVTLAEADVSTELRALFARRIEDAELVISNSRLELPLPLPSGEPVETPGPSAPAEGAGIQIVSLRAISLRDIRVASRGRELLVSADSTLEESTLALRRFTASSGKTQLEAEGVIQLAPRLDATLQMKANQLDVDELLALADAFMPASAATATGTSPAASRGATKGTQGGLPGRVAARVSAATATAGGVEVTNFATELVLEGARATLSPLSFQLFGGRYQGSLNARLGETLSATLRSRIMGVDVAQLAAFGGVPDTVTGTLTGAGTFSGEGADFAAFLATARGDGTAEILDGSVRGLDLVRTVVLFFGRPAPDTAASTDQFERMDAKYSLARQTFRADALSLRSRDADIVGSGTLHIPTKALEGRFDLSLSEELSKQAGTDLARFTREGNRIVLPAVLGGTLAAPRLAIDAQAAAQRGLRNEMERRLKGLLDRFRPQQQEPAAEPQP